MKVVKGGRSLLHIFLPDRGAIRFRLRLLSHESLHFWHCNFVLDFPAWPRGRRLVNWPLPDETEPGSAGTQPGKG
jgi:hypothetical protein